MADLLARCGAAEYPWPRSLQRAIEKYAHRPTWKADALALAA